MIQAVELDSGRTSWPVPSLRRIAIASVLTVAIGFGGLGLWAAVTPLDSAVSTQGLFISAGKRKTVTLLDSGILSRLLVKEGDQVKIGQTLLLLDDVQLRTAMNQINAQYWGAVARAARLRAEIQDRRQFQIPDDLRAAAVSDPAITALLQTEQNLFAARWDTFDGSARINGRKIEQLQFQTIALRSQIASLNKRLNLTREQVNTAEILRREHLETRSRSLDLQRALAELEGAIADAAGRYAEVGQAIEQTKLELINYAETRKSDASKDLQEAQAAIADTAPRLLSAQDLLSKREVLAPENGTVTDIKFFTFGSSISAGQPVMDIVPADERLLVEASIQPSDIEHVQIGQRVNFRLSAYKSHRVPTVEGRLVYVAADRQQDPQGNSFFLVRAELDRDALKPFPGVQIYPGMPADLLIIGGERSALDFLISPIRDGMRHGMREE